MMKDNIITFAKSVALSVATSGLFVATANSETFELPSVSPKQFHLWNGVTVPVTFYLKSSETSWEEHTLMADKTDSYEILNDSSCTVLRISTDEKLYDGNVCEKKRYKIVKINNLFEIRELQPR